MKSFRKFLVRFFGVLVLVALIWGGAWYLFSGVTVTAIFVGTPLPGADVFINDKKVGETPYRTRFTPGMYTIRVVPPADYETKQPEQTLYVITFFRGIDFKAEFDSRESEPR